VVAGEFGNRTGMLDHPVVFGNLNEALDRRCCSPPITPTAMR